MVHQAYYLVRAASALRERLARNAGDVADILLRPMLLSNGEPDRSAWGEREHVARVKLLYLAYLHMEYSQDPSFREFLDEAPVSCEAFDRWWSVERYLLDETSQEIEDRLKRNSAQLLKPTGNPLVDAWIAKLK